MASTSPAWTTPRVCRDARASATPVAAALDRCRPLFRRSVLVVAPGGQGGWDAVRLASEQGARVTTLCPSEQAPAARAAGAEVVLDPDRTDPTWYRGAWSVIVDTTGGIGFRRAMASLSPGGVYVTPSPRPADRARALLARVNGGPRLLRLGG